MALKPVSVTQLNEYISRVLTTDPLLGNIRVTGEITNLKYHSTGHVYFSIKDETSKVNCFFPASYVKTSKVKLEDGMKIIINGYINVYKKGGTYTLFIRSVEDCGAGELASAFEILKQKLDAEGLFAPEKKKPIPKFPKKIGIVTSETGAALQDILKIIKGRTNLVDIVIFPVLVQGAGAAADIAGMLDVISENFDDIDTLIVGRGGGAAEDLQAFNEEIVARAIYRCKIPVISAVGHEIDFTIADFVADRRAETPTAAAEMAVPDMAELRNRVEIFKNNLVSEMNGKIKLDELTASNYLMSMQNALRNIMASAEHRLEKYSLILEENNPTNILGKGYSLMQDMDGGVISSVSAVKAGGEYMVRLKDGTVKVSAIDVNSAN